MDEREKLSDIAHNLERWVNVIVLRTFAHVTIKQMAEYASIPVVNALSDLEHPCQALADYFTLQERFRQREQSHARLRGRRKQRGELTVADVRGAGLVDPNCDPAGYEPDPQIVAHAREIAEETGANITLLTDPYEAVSGVDAVYTDAWVSMGDEEETEVRERIFVPYQVNEDLMAHASPEAVFMHCLPAHRGQEVTDAVIDSPQSVVFRPGRGPYARAEGHPFITSSKGTVSRFPVRSAHA